MDIEYNIEVSSEKYICQKSAEIKEKLTIEDIDGPSLEDLKSLVGEKAFRNNTEHIVYKWVGNSTTSELRLHRGNYRILTKGAKFFGRDFDSSMRHVRNALSMSKATIQKLIREKEVFDRKLREAKATLEALSDSGTRSRNITITV